MLQNGLQVDSNNNIIITEVTTADWHYECIIFSIMTLLSLQVLIEKLSVGFWWYATLDPYWYSVPRTEEVKRNFGAAVCQRAHEPWTIKVRSMCAKLSNRQVCLCAWESQAQLAFWSRAHLLYFSLTPSGRLYLSICPCSSQVAEE